MTDDLVIRLQRRSVWGRCWHGLLMLWRTWRRHGGPWTLYVRLWWAVVAPMGLHWFLGLSWGHRVRWVTFHLALWGHRLVYGRGRLRAR